MSGYFLVLIVSNALWGIPVPYPDPAQCEAAGQSWKSSTRGYRDYHCLPAPAITGESVNRQFKRDAYPAVQK